MIKWAVITAAGLGSRMRSMTLIMPKALLPVFHNGDYALVPMIDVIMGRLRDAGVTNFLIVLGRNGKPLMDYLMDKVFTNALDGVSLAFTFQVRPMGFGDAVLRAEGFINADEFFVHADDGSLTMGYREGVELFNEVKPDALLFLREVNNPSRYGVAMVRSEGEYRGFRLLRVLHVEEKPREPKSNIAISAVYIFRRKIFDALRSVRNEGGELELTYGIEELIRGGGEVYGLLLSGDSWLSIGDPHNYYETLTRTFQERG
ncbi:sugar phosphate nucleotidyltransferase [Vulcanisaeta thermophila]|uniref:sugar phosphate nucleotidyltransferase n=1 Tax=Vulcanisaeta thermophila TaxID=867917 RepID=UPI000852DA83|nr:sugar phosphate nucleotidyltransferase [Vulcanisaeta thermophila]